MYIGFYNFEALKFYVFFLMVVVMNLLKCCGIGCFVFIWLYVFLKVFLCEFRQCLGICKCC